MALRSIPLREPAVIALEALRAHKLRSFLTLLGIIIAVTTLIGVVSIVEGMKAYVAERVGNLGSNTFYINRYGLITNFKDFVEARRRNKKLTLDDYDYLRERMTLSVAVGAVDGREDRRIRAGNESLEGTEVRGVTPNLLDIMREKVGTGRYISEEDYQRRALVVFLGTDVAEKLFPNVDPLGKTVRIEGLPFEVVGVAEKIGTVFGLSQDNFVNIPLTTYRKLFGEGPTEDSGMMIGARYRSPEVREQAMDQARVLLRTRRQLKFEEKDTFGIFSSESLRQLWDLLFGGLAALAVGVASVFLVVGGIVIMNIMLASVTERTREIGIRKALGARRRDILLQFLVEASVMSTVGGVLGVLGALGLAQVVAAVTPVPMRTPVGAVVLAVGVSTAVGLFFGLWPARKAARYDPVVALRAE